jgi:hypothetical protein
MAPHGLRAASIANERSGTDAYNRSDAGFRLYSGAAHRAGVENPSSVLT